MEQILNKMVHLKYPILEIWCCHKHTNQLLPSGLKFDTKLRKVFPNNLAAQLCTSHSRRQNIPPYFVSLFELANQILIQASKTQILATSNWHLLLFSNVVFKAQIWQKAEEYVPKLKQVCQHTSAPVIVTGKIRRVLYVNFECLFWPIKCMHSKPRYWVHFGHCFPSSMPSLRL